MRILLDTSPLQSGHAGRGIGRYTSELLTALRAEAQYEGDSVVVQASHELGGFPVSPEQHCDIVHSPYFDLFFPTLNLWPSVPQVVTVHDVIPLIYPTAYPPGIKGRLRFWQQRRRLQQVAAIITDSVCSQRDIVRYLHVSPENVFVVPLAAPSQLTPATEYQKEKAVETLNLPTQYIAYVGDINYNKNLSTLLLALTQLPEDLHLCVVSGTFQNTAIPEGQQLQRIIQENKLGDRVHVLSIPHGEMGLYAGVLARSRCLVQPSLYEGFGLPVLEALVAGTLVVSSNGGSLPEVAGEVCDVVPPTLQGLTDGIARAVRCRGEERVQKIAAGRVWAERFSWQRTARATLKVYATARAQWERTQKRAA